jgi:glycosyltransferase involved in cell wall biosynthesis
MTKDQDATSDVGTLRVAHVGWYAPDSASGPSNAIVGILQNLPHHRVQVELWHFDRGRRRVSWREVDGIRVLDLPSRGRVASFLLGLPKQSQEALRTRSQHVDLVHFHSVFIPENARAGSLLRAPYVISPRGGYNRSVLRGRNRLAKRIWMAMHERRYISSARALHAVSLAEALELEELVPTEQIFYVPNGIEQKFLERPVSDPPDKTLVFLGRLAMQHKGIDLLLGGYSEFLKRSGDRSSELVIAGPDFRDDRQRIEDQIRALGLHDRVSLPGGVFGEDKRNLVDRAYAFVLTSRWEGMPFVLLEALAAGRPVLVTPETNLGGVVASHGAGVEVVGEVQQIAMGIQFLLSLPRDDYIRMQHQARQLISDNFTWERVIGELASTYRGITGRTDQ